MTYQANPTDIPKIIAELSCNCHPATNTVNTYAGWKEQGRQVTKGQHAFISLQVGQSAQSVDHLFCQCQTTALHEVVDESNDGYGKGD